MPNGAFCVGPQLPNHKCISVHKCICMCIHMYLRQIFAYACVHVCIHICQETLGCGRQLPQNIFLDMVSVGTPNLSAILILLFDKRLKKICSNLSHPVLSHPQWRTLHGTMSFICLKNNIIDGPGLPGPCPLLRKDWTKSSEVPPTSAILCSAKHQPPLSI